MYRRKQLFPVFSFSAFLLISLSFITCLLCPPETQALEISGDKVVVKKFIDEVSKDIGGITSRDDLDLEEKRDELALILVKYIDLPYMARSTIGPFWRRLPKDLKLSYITSFNEYIKKFYKGKYDGGHVLEYKIVSMKKKGRNVFVVKVSAKLNSSKSRMETEYYVKIKNSNKTGKKECKILEVNIAGVGLISSLRASFGERINDIGVVDFIKEFLEENPVDKGW